MKKRSRRKPGMTDFMQYVRICLRFLPKISLKSVREGGRLKHVFGSWRQISWQGLFISTEARESKLTFSSVFYPCWFTGYWRRKWTRTIPAMKSWIRWKALSSQMYKARALSPFTSPKLTDELHRISGFESDYEFITKRKMREIQKLSKRKQVWKKFQKLANRRKRLYIKTKQHRCKPLVEWALQRCFVL